MTPAIFDPCPGRAAWSPTLRRRPAHLAVASALAAALVVLAGCARTTEDRTASTDAPATSAAGGESIYDLDLPLTDADGGALRLADLRDTVRVAAMMYTSCKAVCPRITQDMQGIERQLSKEDMKGVGFVLFSLDPEHDSPEALRGFAADHALDASRWRLFSTTEDGVRDLAAVLGVKYKEEADGEFAHSAMIFVLDKRGVVRHRQLGLNADAGELITAIHSAR